MHFLAAWIWQHLTSDRLHVPRNISKDFISHVMKKFGLLWEDGFENSLKLYRTRGRLEE
jgi:hypothetical protein